MGISNDQATNPSTQGLAAARRGDALHKWVNDKIPGADPVVLNDAGLIYNIPEGKRVVITSIIFSLDSAADSCVFEIGSCDQAAAAGNFTPLSIHFEIYTGQSVDGRSSSVEHFAPPLIVCYSEGARSISVRVDANDAGAVISTGWHGWIEDDI